MSIARAILYTIRAKLMSPLSLRTKGLYEYFREEERQQS